MVRLVAAAAALLVVIAGLLAFFPRTPDVDPTSTPAIRLDVSYPQGVLHPLFGASVLALSPDGEVLVFVGLDADGETHLYRRRISEFDCNLIPGTQDAGSPFFSPDGTWVAFFAGGELRKTPTRGGAVIRICASSFAFGGTWTDDGSIIFAGSYPSGLSIVSADGGEVGQLTSLRADFRRDRPLVAAGSPGRPRRALHDLVLHPGDPPASPCSTWSLEKNARSSTARRFHGIRRVATSST